MAQHKPTTDRRQALTFFGLLAGASAFFGFIILPYLDPARSALLGKPAPDFTLSVIAGGEPGNRFSLGDQRDKIVVLDFWASWCAPCRAQAPVIERLATQFADSDVVVVGVNTADRLDAAHKYLSDAQLDYVSVSDSQGAVANAFTATELPTLVVIDKQGIVRSVTKRVLAEDEVLALIDQAR